MELDTNQLCPGGTGKKIRFCCKDLTRELDKIVRLMEGGQRRAAIEAIDKTLAAKGDRACLYALKSEVQATAGDEAGVKATMKEFAQKFPDNPTALAEGAMAAIEDGRPAEAVDLLQTALERSSDTIDEQVYAAYGIVAQGLLLSGDLPGARAHLMMQADLSRGRDPAPLELLARIDHAPQAPPLLKFPVGLEKDESPAGGPWQAELTQAVETAARGEWRRALQRMRTLADQHPESAVLRKNIALLASRLGDRAAAARAWRDFAALESAPWDDRVEAEAIAQLLTPTDEDETLEEVKVTYAIRDLDRLTERLLSDPRVIRYEGDLRELVEENETPPKNVFSLLDRPEKQVEGAELTVETVPNVLGEIYLYGKRTDREARLEFETTRDERFETARQTLADAAGEWLGPVEGEEVMGKTSRVAAALSWRWRFPPETPPERQRELMDQKRRELILHRWPDVPRANLDGRTPREAVGQEAYRVRVAGAVLLLEIIGEQMHWGIDFNHLREMLGLPKSELIDPGAADLRRLPIVRFSRLPIERLSDEDLLIAYQRAAGHNYRESLAPLAREALRRESLREKIDPAAAHQILAQTAASPQEAIEHLHKCREMVVKRGESPARLLLEEFRLRLLTGEGVEQCERILEQLRSHHMNEPGVAQALYQMLVEFGIIAPEGRSGPGVRKKGETAAETAAMTAGPSKLWTPDAPGGAPAAGEKKPKFWTPEID